MKLFITGAVLMADGGFPRHLIRRNSLQSQFRLISLRRRKSATSSTEISSLDRFAALEERSQTASLLADGSIWAVVVFGLGVRLARVARERFKNWAKNSAASVLFLSDLIY